MTTKDEMRILVCGGRDFNDREAVWKALDRLKPALVIEGGARGADRLAGEWADWTHTPHLIYRADWGAEGKAAGILRNQRMLDHGRPDMVLAFPGGRGTADMIRRARAAGVPIQHEVRASHKDSNTPGES